jgi:hypothetical protein
LAASYDVSGTATGSRTLPAAATMPKCPMLTGVYGPCSSAKLFCRVADGTEDESEDESRPGERSGGVGSGRSEGRGEGDGSRSGGDMGRVYSGGSGLHSIGADQAAGSFSSSSMLVCGDADPSDPPLGLAAAGATMDRPLRAAFSCSGSSLRPHGLATKWRLMASRRANSLAQIGHWNGLTDWWRI